MKATLSGDVRAPGHARAFVRDQLSGRAVPEGVLLDNVLLVVDELVTNAVTAGATSVGVNLKIDARRLEIVVTDDAAGWPTPRTASTRDVHGRGLTIVGHLTDTWKVAARRVGKSVTATWFGPGHRRNASPS